MRYMSAAHTDVGISKEKNQDSFCLETAKTTRGNVAFCILCDGMGGLQAGELASSFLVNAFARWFENELPDSLQGGVDFKKIENRWRDIAKEQAAKIMEYGRAHGYSKGIGTTLTAVLVYEGSYIYIQVGDSRMYQLGAEMTQITADQTLIAREIAQKRLTEEQAKTDSRRSVLLQCIGATREVSPEIGTGSLAAGEELMLCSDGFRHEISSDEIFGVLAPSLMNDERTMKKSLVDLVNLNKNRGERDNITVLLLKARA